MPADSPSVAVASKNELCVRLEKSRDGAEADFKRLKPDKNIADQLIELGGVWKEYTEEPLVIPPIKPQFILTRASDSEWVKGRAGMEYRDLIPGRLGGAVVASHIRIPKGGPVPDYVHYHKVLFQMIYCKAGWVRVVYEDQGEPFVMNAGDCVLQPPGIRHRVLECSDNFEVIEVSMPAIHQTYVEHEMELPTGKHLPDRLFGGQKFVRHIESEAEWCDSGDGYEYQDFGIGEATGELVEVRVIKGIPVMLNRKLGHLAFGFVLDGKMELDVNRRGKHKIIAGTCCVISHGVEYNLLPGDRLTMLEVTF
jgi:quercetin dioxygenase-like cupin family protein